MCKKTTMTRKLATVFLTAFIAAVLSGLAPGNVYAADKLTVKPASKTINVGKTVGLKANQKVKWTVVKGKKYIKLTSKKAKSVKVKGVKKGTAVVQAAAGSRTKKITVKVLPALKVSPAGKTIKAGKTVTLKSNNSAKWSVSSGNGIITLSSVKSKSVVVTGLKEGSAAVKVKDAKTGVSKTVKITVTAKPSEPSKPSEPAKPSEPSKPEEPGQPEDPGDIDDGFVPETATTDEVNAMLSDSDANTELIDARPQEAYAGWALQGAKNGGHLKNAVLYSARWLDFEISSSKRDKKLASYNKAIGLSADKTYIVYDYAGIKDAAVNVAKYFHKQGVKNVKVYDAKGMIDAGNDLQSYENYDRFLPAEIVRDISDYKTGKDETLEPSTTAVISEEDMDKVILVDVSYGNVHESSYLSGGHVPGAVHINTNVYERPRSYIPEKREKYSIEYSLIPLDEFRDDVCTQYGITKDSIVIAMSEDGRPIARIGFMLRSLGVRFYGMSGLMNAWKYNGYPLDTATVVKPASVESFGLDTIPCPGEIVWMDEIKEILAANGEDETNHTAGTIVGSDKVDSTYSYHDLMGKIQGTLNASGGVFENPDGTPAMQELFLKYYEENNIPTDKPIIHFCGDGWGAARDAYNAQSVDISNAKCWGEGWVVWSNRGNWFIDHAGRKVMFDKYLNEVVDEAGNIVSDGKNMKAE